MASTYSDINYNVDPTLKDSEHGHGIMNGFNGSESALLDYVDGFPTENESTADFRVEEITEITIERVPVPQVVVKVEPLTEVDSGVNSQVSLSEHEEEEPLLSKEIVVCEVHSSSEPVPENSLVLGKDGGVKFEIKDYGSDSHEEVIHIISTETTEKIEKHQFHNPPQTTFFYERMLLESQSSASFNMDDIYSSCTSSSDDSEDSYLYRGHMTSMDTVCQSLLPWRRHDDYEAIEKVDDEKASDEKKKENWCRVLLEIGLPFLMSGFGCIGAGYVLDKVQHWIVFVKVSEIFILVPALLGLKGNLEMTLASRLSTQSNIGNMDDRREQWKMIGGNLALTQAQAVVVGFLAALAAMLLAWIPEGKFDIHHAFLLCASSVLTAALASFILGSVMIIVVLLSRKCNINPDNVATPIAASLGDLTTLALLSTLANFFWVSLGSSKVWIAPTALALCLLLTPLWCYISYRNKYVKEVLISGWTPVIGAMMISSFGGLILDFAVASYHGIAVFQPVVNGVGGNLVAVQASRLSTSLHQRSKPGVLPEDAVHGCPNPCWTFFGKGSAGRTARVLLLMVIPGHLIFIYTISFMQAGHTSITPIFAAVYLTAATLQVVVLLYTSNWLVHWLWKRGNDPDNFSIPYLTALGDLLGGALLAIAFHILYVVGDKDSDGFL